MAPPYNSGIDTTYIPSYWPIHPLSCSCSCSSICSCLGKANELIRIELIISAANCGVQYNTPFVLYVF